MIEDLEREGLIRKLPHDPKRVRNAMDHAWRDVGVSKTMLTTNEDWAYTIAYNALLQAGRALMFSKGYRPEGSHQHIAVVKFCELFLEEEDAVFFDMMRRKRNRAVYDDAGRISESEAVYAVKRAEEVVRKIETILNRST